MLVRVVKACSQPIDRTGRNFMLREGRVVNWDRDGELPEYFEEVEPVQAVGNADIETGVAAAPAAAPPILHALDRDSQIVEALYRLDRDDDDQWTTMGLPRVESVSEMLDELGFDPEVTRPEINVAKPGFTRE